MVENRFNMGAYLLKYAGRKRVIKTKFKEGDIAIFYKKERILTFRRPSSLSGDLLFRRRQTGKRKFTKYTSVIVLPGLLEKTLTQKECLGILKILSLATGMGFEIEEEELFLSAMFKK